MNQPPQNAEGKSDEMVQLREMDSQTGYSQQLRHQGDGAVVLINHFNVAPEAAHRFLDAWADDAAFMKQHPGFISTQLHRGIAGSSTFINVAVWETARALGHAFSSPEFQTRAARYPDGTVAVPHLFERVAVPGICVGVEAAGRR